MYGTAGTAAPGNTPGGRYAASNWADSEGNLWLLAGIGLDASGTWGRLDDTWKFDVTSREWTWIGGMSTVPQSDPAIYGTEGTAAPANTPGSRKYSNNWVDGAGNFWLFAGGVTGDLDSGNDLWKFQPSTKEWTWVGGADTVPPGSPGVSGIYGTLGVPGRAVWPGTRGAAYGCSDTSGKFWLFGGGGEDSAGNGGLLNDLFVYDPVLGEWTWMAGSSTVLPPGYSGATAGGPNPTYGTQGVPAPGNTPGGRYGGACWIDSGGNLWLFGGYGQHLSGATSDWNDMWEFNATTLEWTWVSGIDAITDCIAPALVCGNPGVYGVPGVPAAGNLPGARIYPTAWTDLAGNFWLFGGLGFDENDNLGELNDLWEFSPITRQWTWQGGNSSTGTSYCVSWNGSSLKACGSAGVYGAKSVANAMNAPGGRDSAMGWADGNGNLWLFGGEGFDGLGQYGDLNDLWMIRPVTSGQPIASTPAFSLPSGTYMSSQTVSISDATPGAVIYYSLDGTPPSLNSPIYTGPLSVMKTQAVEAIATVAGYDISKIATGSYVLPKQFTLAANPGALQLKAGSTGTVNIAVTPVNGFSSAVTLVCAGLPLQASCTFSPAHVTPSGGPVNSTLTITAPQQLASVREEQPTLLPITGLALVVCVVFRRQKSKVDWMMILVLVATSFSIIPGCSGGSGGNGNAGVGSPPITGTATVTATSGSLVQTTTITVTFN